MSELPNILRSRLRGPHSNKHIARESSRARSVLAAVAMAAQGGNVVVVMPDRIMARTAMDRAIAQCQLADIDYMADHNALSIQLKPVGRIIFTPMNASPEKFMGLELTGVWVNETS